MNDLLKELLKERCFMTLKGQDINNFETPHYVCAHKDRLELYKEVEKLKQENEKLYSLINRMQKYFAPTSGEWQFIEAMLENIKEASE